MPPYAETKTITHVEEPYNRGSKRDGNESDDKLKPFIQSALTDVLPDPPPYKSWFGTYKTALKWHHIIPITLFHALTFYLIFCFPFTYSWPTVFWGFWVGGMAGFGVTAGAHRHFCHRSYKVKLPLKLILLACYAMAGQNRLHEWVRDHRVHHKYSETVADPHDSNRGFFFAHMGWLFMRKHPEVIRRGNKISMTDITNDPHIMFFDKYFIPIKVLFCFFLPTIIPIFCWGETFRCAVVSQIFVRYMLSLHFTWSVNSAAHLFGNKPYDRTINPRENAFVSLIALGEGWHNYHHTFPWDYKAAELFRFNVTLWWIDFFAKIGWAYDLKSPNQAMVDSVKDRKGENATRFGQPMTEEEIRMLQNQGY